jgi:hypothetical protein
VRYMWNCDRNTIHTGLGHLLAVRHIRILHCMCRCLIIQCNEVNLFEIFLLRLFEPNLGS